MEQQEPRIKINEFRGFWTMDNFSSEIGEIFRYETVDYQVIKAEIEQYTGSKYSNDFVIYFRKGTRIDYQHMRNLDLYGYEIINIQLDQDTGRIRLAIRKVRTAFT
jgi:hypothetical protein